MTNHLVILSDTAKLLRKLLLNVTKKIQNFKKAEKVSWDKALSIPILSPTSTIHIFTLQPPQICNIVYPTMRCCTVS